MDGVPREWIYGKWKRTQLEGNVEMTRILNSNMRIQALSLIFVRDMNVALANNADLELRGNPMYIKGGTAYALWLNNAVQAISTPVVKEFYKDIKDMLYIKSDIDTNIGAKSQGQFDRLREWFNESFDNKREAELRGSALPCLQQYVVAIGDCIRSTPALHTYNSSYRFQQVQAVKIYREDMPFALYRLLATYYNPTNGLFVIAELVDISVVKTFNRLARSMKTIPITLKHLWYKEGEDYMRTPDSPQPLNIHIMTIRAVLNDLELMINDPSPTADAKREKRTLRRDTFIRALCSGIGADSPNIGDARKVLYPIIGPYLILCKLDPINILSSCAAEPAKGIVDYVNETFKENCANYELRVCARPLSCYASIQYFKHIRAYYAHPSLIALATKAVATNDDFNIDADISRYEQANQMRCEILQPAIFDEIKYFAIRYNYDADITFTGGFSAHLYTSYITNRRYNTSDIDVTINIKNESRREEIYGSILEICKRIRDSATIAFGEDIDTNVSVADTDDDFYRGVIVKDANILEIHVRPAGSDQRVRLFKNLSLFVLPATKIADNCLTIAQDVTQHALIRYKYFHRYFTMLEINALMHHYVKLYKSVDVLNNPLSKYEKDHLNSKEFRDEVDRLFNIQKTKVGEFKILLTRYEISLRALAVSPELRQSTQAAAEAVQVAATSAKVALIRPVQQILLGPMTMPFIFGQQAPVAPVPVPIPAPALPPAPAANEQQAAIQVAAAAMTVTNAALALNDAVTMNKSDDTGKRQRKDDEVVQRQIELDRIVEESKVEVAQAAATAVTAIADAEAVKSPDMNVEAPDAAARRVIEETIEVTKEIDVWERSKYEDVLYIDEQMKANRVEYLHALIDEGSEHNPETAQLKKELEKYKGVAGIEELNYSNPKIWRDLLARLADAKRDLAAVKEAKYKLYERELTERQAAEQRAAEEDARKLLLSFYNRPRLSEEGKRKFRDEMKGGTRKRKNGSRHANRRTRKV